MVTKCMAFLRLVSSELMPPYSLLYPRNCRTPPPVMGTDSPRGHRPHHDPWLCHLRLSCILVLISCRAAVGARTPFPSATLERTWLHARWCLLYLGSLRHPEPHLPFLGGHKEGRDGPPVPHTSARAAVLTLKPLLIPSMNTQQTGGKA